MRRLRGVLFLSLLPCLSPANGAMGLGLEMWDLSFWYAYVVATLIFEAWMIGRWMKVGWGRCLWLSLLANFVTGVFCGVGGLVAPFLHQAIVGSRLNPNPFLNGVALLTIFAVPSALFEFYFWDLGGRKRSPLIQRRTQVFGRTVLAHLVGVPLALVILLIPTNPYKPLQWFTDLHRRFALFDFSTDLQAYVSKTNRLPTATDINRLIQDVPNVNESNPRDPEFWAAFYRPDFRRFDTGEAKRRPFLLNTSLAGKRVNSEAEQDEEKFVWYLKPDLKPGEVGWGLAVDPVWGVFAKMLFPEESVPDW